MFPGPALYRHPASPITTRSPFRQSATNFTSSTTSSATCTHFHSTAFSTRSSSRNAISRESSTTRFSSHSAPSAPCTSNAIWARIEQPSIFKTQALVLIVHYRIETGADHNGGDPCGNIESSLDGVPEDGLLAMYIRETMIQRDVMRLMRQVRLSGQPLPQLADPVDEFAKSLQQLDIPAYSLQDLQRYSTSRWLVRYITVHLSWHQAHCDVHRLFLSGYREAAPAIVISAFSPEYIAISASLCLHHAQAMIAILTDWANIGFCPVTAHYDIAVCGYQACHLILFLSRSPLLPMDSNLTPDVASAYASSVLALCKRLYQDSALMKHLIKDLEAVIQSHAAGEPEHRRDSSDPGDDTTEQPCFAVPVQRHKRLGVHSVLRGAGFVDDSTESAEAPHQAPASAVAPAITQPTMLNPASEMDTSAFESLVRASMAQTPLENGPQFGMLGEPFNFGLWDTWPDLSWQTSFSPRSDADYL
ncbi:hypothetical protein QQZ08_009118 [Neonectria magnoliae]|uniref:Transcription factor domain-containing protein n=1 Tax=Neonectria magnoliae TaxID=2732573 RepID=A0ABR1HPV3_9HYPO